MQIKARFKSLLFMLKEAAANFSSDKASGLSAALSYFTIFSLPPLLLIVIAVAGLALGDAAASGSLVEQFHDYVGREGASVIQTMIRNASRPKSGIIAASASIILLIIGATGVFTSLQDALNTIWKVRRRPAATLKAIHDTLKFRARSLCLVIVIGILLLASLILSAALAVFAGLLKEWLPVPVIIVHLLQLADLLLSFGVMTLLFGMIFKFIPDIKIAWRGVLMGAAMTAALFSLGKILLGLYLGRGAVGSVYGAAGSLAVVLMWVYYSSMILLFGAEFTKVWARRHGHQIKPAEGAELIT
jgi:membrane protein